MKINTAIQYLTGLGVAFLLAACAANPPCPAAARPPPPPPPPCAHHGWHGGNGPGPQAAQQPPSNMPAPGEQPGARQGGQFGTGMHAGQSGPQQDGFGMGPQSAEPGRGVAWRGFGMGPQGGPQMVPPESYEACAGKKSGDACVARKEGWELKGNCSAIADADARFACVPPQPKGQGSAAGWKPAAPPAKPAAK